VHDDFWRLRIEADRFNPRQFRHAVDQILGRCELRPCELTDVEQFSAYFNDKVQFVRAAVQLNLHHQLF
jgi:hypothetical protein